MLGLHLTKAVAFTVVVVAHFGLMFGCLHAIYLRGKKYTDDRGHAPVRYVLAMLALLVYHWTLAFPVVRACVDFLEAL